MFPAGTDGSHVGRPVCLFAGAAALALVLGCRSEFTGPYPCAPDFASCVAPTQNTCETNVSMDGLNCGACGTVCGVGAPCVASQCGQTAAMVASLSADSPTLLQTNSSAVFWHGANSIFMLSSAAGAVPTTIAMDAVGCNSGQPFAVDDANLYYWSDGSDCGTSSCAGLNQLSLADRTRTVLVPQPMSGGPNFCGAFAVGATTVYALVGQQQQGNMITYTLYGAQIGVAGQALKSIASIQSYNGPSTSLLAINSTALFFQASNANNAPSIEMVPLTGGPPTALPINLNTYGGSVQFVVDDANIYAVGGGCFCDGNSNNNGNGNGSSGIPPAGAVVKVPLSGGPSTVLSRFSGEVGGIAIDSTNVYWSTDTSAWKAPLAGGASTTIAGNLTNGLAPFRCLNCGGSGQSQPSAIAATASGVYIAVSGTSENAVLEVAK